MYFYSFMRRTGYGGEYELMFKFPFKKREVNEHDNIRIRRTQEYAIDPHTNPYAISATKLI